MDEKKIGRQTPTVSAVLPYTETKGGEAVALYNKSGRKAWGKLKSGVGWVCLTGYTKEV
jgi:hypothetical protein